MSKMMKKVMALLCTASISASMLAGCSSGSEKQTTKATDGAAKETTAATGETKGETQKETAKAADSGEKKRIGISLVYKGDEWCAAVDQEFSKQASEFGYEVNIQDGNLDNETQVKQIENFITQQYDLIAVDPASPEGIIPALESRLLYLILQRPMKTLCPMYPGTAMRQEP